MKSKAIFIVFNNVNFVFHLFDDDINELMKRKLKNLGLPDIFISWPENKTDKFMKISCDHFKQGDFQCDGIFLTSTTNKSIYSAAHDPFTNTVSVHLNGEFFCINSMDDNENAFLKQTHGFVSGARFRDTKDKLIKKSKDKWGLTSPLEGRIVKNSYDGESQKIKFRIVVKNGVYKYGQLV